MYLIYSYMKELRNFFMNHFDQIYCINLDKRKDRWHLVENLFKELGIYELIVRYSAVEYNPGNMGCALSHAAVLKDAKAKGYNKIFVFEDDVEVKSMSLFLHTISNYPVNIDRKLLLLGYSFLYINWYDEMDIGNNYWKVWCGLSWAMAIGYDRQVFDEIINFIGEDMGVLEMKMNLRTGFDRWIAISLQRRYLTLVSKNNLLYEGYTFSNIKNWAVDIYPRMENKKKIYLLIFNNTILKYMYKNIYLKVLKIYWYIKWWIV